MRKLYLRNPKEELNDQLKQVQGHLKSVKYTTTKEFLNLKEDEIKSGLILISKIDELPRQFNSDPSKDLYLLIDNLKLLTEYMKRKNDFSAKWYDYWRFLLGFR